MIIIIANILVGLVAFLHVYFLILEMFLWDKPFGLRTFGHSQASASAAKILAMNQGLYNGFLAAGLAWGLSLGAAGHSIKVFFLACVVIAGVFGGLTASRKILLVQALPAAAALALVFLSGGSPSWNNQSRYKHPQTIHRVSSRSAGTSGNHPVSCRRIILDYFSQVYYFYAIG